jgi:thioredoxin-like negative regulator of GroEL
MTRRTLQWMIAALAALSTCQLVTLAHAQESTTSAVPEVHWRREYNAARQEALKKGRPIILDFGTDHCFWCQKLDVTTFRDETVVRLMNERFIPLKINAEKEPKLASLLRVQSYPTLVIGAPDGKILNFQEGYLDATRFVELLQRALAAVTSPDWMTRDYQAAVKAIADSDYPRAIALLTNVTQDGKTRPVQLKARKLLTDLDQQAATRLSQAKQLSDRSQTAEAIDTLTELLRVFKGTRAAGEASQMLASLRNTKKETEADQRLRRARDLLAQARKDYDTGQYLWCLDRCEVLAANYAELPEGEQARLIISELKNNPSWMQTACENETDRLGTLYLSLAEIWLKKGQSQQATQCLERVVKTFPGSRHAELARLRLAQIQGRPTTEETLTQQTNFKKQ